MGGSKTTARETAGAEAATVGGSKATARAAEAAIRGSKATAGAAGAAIRGSKEQLEQQLGQQRQQWEDKKNSSNNSSSRSGNNERIKSNRRTCVEVAIQMSVTVRARHWMYVHQCYSFTRLPPCVISWSVTESPSAVLGRGEQCWDVVVVIFRLFGQFELSYIRDSFHQDRG